MRGGSPVKHESYSGSRSEACSPQGVQDPLEPRSDLSGFISHIGLGMPRHHTAKHKDVRVFEKAHTFGVLPGEHPPIRELCKSSLAILHQLLKLLRCNASAVRNGSSICYSLSATSARFTRSIFSFEILVYTIITSKFLIYYFLSRNSKIC